MRRWFFFFTFISHINFCRTINQIGMKTRHSCCWHFVVSITPRRSIKIFIFGKVVGRRWLKIFHNWKLETGFWHVETKMIIVLFVWKLVFLSLAFFRSLLFHLLFVYLSYHLPRGSNRSSKWFLIWISARHERLCSRCSSRTPGSMHFCCRWFDFGPTHTHTHTAGRFGKSPDLVTSRESHSLPDTESISISPPARSNGARVQDLRLSADIIIAI